MFNLTSFRQAAIVLSFGAIFLFAGNVRSNYLTVISRGFTTAETGSPFFACYTEVHNPVITTGRYVNTRNPSDELGERNLPPPDPDTFLTVDQASIVYRTELSALQPYESYGVFYCELSVNRTRTVVPTIFLRSDAYFIPSGGRFTLTETAGQTNVSIRFDQLYQREDIEDNLWRFNGTTFRTTPDIAYTITDSIQPSQEGIYEIHVNLIRHLSRSGLMRVIVTECPSGRYNISSDCTMTCSSCYNGGVCDDETGECICAPGFKGETCQYGCGSNRFGKSCENRCNTSVDGDTACRGIQMCLPDPYGCSCAPGYKDLNCTTECNAGEFGASCTETCHCVSGECDRFTGVCIGSSALCQPGWTGSNCQECIPGRFGPNCSGTVLIENTPKNEGQPNIRFTCHRVGEEEYSSLAQPIVRLYRINDGSGQLSDDGIWRLGDSQQESSTTDVFQVDHVTAEDMFVCIIYDVNNYRSDIIHADLNILPQLKRAPLIQETTQTSITLTWDEWMAGEDIGDPPLIGYNVYYKEEALDSLPWIRFDRENDTEAAERADGLDPDTDYIFAVSAVREGQGGEGPLKEASASTKCLPPTGVVSHVMAHQVSSPDELLITWQLPTSGANCRSGMANISIYFSTVNHVSLVESVKIPFRDTTETHYLDSVLPDTQYAIYITLWNKDAEGPSSQSSLGMTSQRKTSAVPWVTFGVTLALLLASLGTIIFLWRRVKTNPATPKANKTIQEQPPYENPTFEESLIHTYESTIRMDPTTDIDYINVK